MGTKLRDLCKRCTACEVRFTINLGEVCTKCLNANRKKARKPAPDIQPTDSKPKPVHILVVDTRPQCGGGFRVLRRIHK